MGQGQIETGWAVHVIGPDDILDELSFAEALKAQADINAEAQRSHADHPDHPKFWGNILSPEDAEPSSWLVVICREGVSEVTKFDDEPEACAFFAKAREQWSDSYLACVVAGPKV